MSTVEKTVFVVTCDGCDQPALSEGQDTSFDSLEQAIALLTAFGIDWQYSETGVWTCDTCRAVEACHTAGGHAWGKWTDSFLRDGSRWRGCERSFDFGRCPGYETRAIETARVKEGIL